jgi:transposase
MDRAVGLIQGGWSHRRVANEFEKSKSVISRLWQRFILTGSPYPTHGGGSQRKTTPRVDRFIRHVVRHERTKDATQVKNLVNEVHAVQVSSETIRRRLHEEGIRARRPKKCLLLTVVHKRQRLNFAVNHANWGPQQWSNCLFTDESRFCLHGNDGRTRVWRRRGERFNEDCMVQHVPFGGGSVTVWGGISRNNRTELVLFDHTVTGENYLREVLVPVILPYAENVGEQFVYIDDNARPHRARQVNNFFEENRITRMHWPARSPDCNPIEHLWDYLKRRVRKAHPAHQNLQELRNTVVREWNAIPQDIIRHLIDSMPRRCAAVIRSRGGPTRY